MQVRQPMKQDTRSSIQKLYEAIPDNLTEMTKQGIIKWINLGCTPFSMNILQDADVYEAQFSYKPHPEHPIPPSKIQIIASDEDCYLLICSNLISNAQVCRLRNYIKSQEIEEYSLVYQLMNSYNQRLADIYKICMKDKLAREDKK